LYIQIKNKKIKVMKLIKLTSLRNSEDIYINIGCIGHMYEVAETKSYGSIDKPKHTKIGVITHNNGGFEVKETVKEITRIIESKGFNGGIIIEK
jgi:hypothetical protein